MTDEEMAEKYAIEDLPDGYKKINYAKKQSYLAGLAEGRKELAEKNEELKNMASKQVDLILELYDQIEKMKCCQNCKHDRYHICVSEIRCENFEQWELAE